MTDPMDDLRQASADVSGVEVLSPAAQAVRKAYYSTDDELAGPAIAAALRAVADQVVPDEGPRPDLVYGGIHWDERQRLRAKLLAIAAELEGASG